MQNIFQKKYFLKKLEEYSVIFKSVYELGEAEYSDKIPTACICKSKGDDKIKFLINYDFFWSLNETDQLFVICHESLHLFFRHLNDVEKYKLNPKIANIAMDIVINETLVNHFGFKRNLLSFSKSIAFINTVFSEEQIAEHNLNITKSYHYFYGAIMREIEKNSDFEEKINKLSSIDDHSVSYNDNEQKDSDKSSEKNTSESDQDSSLEDDLLSDQNSSSSEDEQDLSENNQDGEGNQKKEYFDLSPEDIENLIDNVCHNNDFDKKQLENFEELMKNTFNKDDFEMVLENKNVTLFKKKEKKKWQKLIEFVNPSIMTDKLIEKDSFAKEANHFLYTLDKRFVLPARLNSYGKSKDKIDLYFFMDVSGSCIAYVDLFLDIVSKIPIEMFNLHLYSFDTKTEEIEIDYKQKRFKKYINIGGGTDFSVINNQIENDLKNKKIRKYPDFVCVLTDGYSYSVQNIPEKHQNKWLWLIISEKNEFLRWFELQKKEQIIPFHDSEYNPYQPKINKKIKTGCKIMPVSSIT